MLPPACSSQLVLIHTRGQADNLRPDTEPVAQFEDFDVYMPQRIIVNAKTGQSAVFGDEAGSAVPDRLLRLPDCRLKT
jgi:hypothetical protein